MPKSCSTVCPRPESCDEPRALMSVAPNLCCDETKNRGTYTHVTIGRNDAKAQTPVLWPPHVKSWLIGKDSDAGKDWGRKEGEDRGRDGWMISLTRWTWVWVNSGSWWWTGRPGVLRFMGLQRVGHDWGTELNWTELSPFNMVSEWPCLRLMFYDTVLWQVQ